MTTGPPGTEEKRRALALLIASAIFVAFVGPPGRFIGAHDWQVVVHALAFVLVAVSAALMAIVVGLPEPVRRRTSWIRLSERELLGWATVAFALAIALLVAELVGFSVDVIRHSPYDD